MLGEKHHTKCLGWYQPFGTEGYLRAEGFSGGSEDKELACNAEDPGSIPGLGRYAREGNGYSVQYSCLGNPRTEEPGGLQSRRPQELDTT